LRGKNIRDRAVTHSNPDKCFGGNPETKYPNKKVYDLFKHSYSPLINVTVSPIPDMAVTFPRIKGAVVVICTAEVGAANVSAIDPSDTQLRLSVLPSISTVAETALAPVKIA
jgi:hypothetical protein